MSINHTVPTINMISVKILSFLFVSASIFNAVLAQPKQAALGPTQQISFVKTNMPIRLPDGKSLNVPIVRNGLFNTVLQKPRPQETAAPAPNSLAKQQPMNIEQPSSGQSIQISQIEESAYPIGPVENSLPSDLFMPPPPPPPPQLTPFQSMMLPDTTEAPFYFGSVKDAPSGSGLKTRVASLIAKYVSELREGDPLVGIREPIKFELEVDHLGDITGNAMTMSGKKIQPLDDPMMPYGARQSMRFPKGPRRAPIAWR
ncbi:hypothetical protein ACOME3_006027 [Neoechinorhynchus agilis]